jgi:peptidyl-prolyl cis-trans isomerase-like 4
MAVLLETSKGDMVVDLFTEDCPLASRNFLKLCKCVPCSCALASSAADVRCMWSHSHVCSCHSWTADTPCVLGRRMKYYNDVLFHNVQKGFIAQTGDPTGTGKGGSSVYGCAYSRTLFEARSE